MEDEKESDVFVIEGKEGLELDNELNELAKQDKKKLVMSYCTIKATQQFQNEVTKLEELTIIASDIKDKALKDLNFSALKKLTIQNCHLTLDEIANLTSRTLTHLDLSHNQIAGIESDFRFNLVSELEELNLCKSELTSKQPAALLQRQD